MCRDIRHADQHDRPEEINALAVNTLLGEPTHTRKQFAGDITKYYGTYEGYGKGTRMIVTLTKRDSVLTAQFGTGRIRST